PSKSRTLGATVGSAFVANVEPKRKAQLSCKADQAAREDKTVGDRFWLKINCRTDLDACSLKTRPACQLCQSLPVTREELKRNFILFLELERLFIPQPDDKTTVGELTLDTLENTTTVVALMPAQVGLHASRHQEAIDIEGLPNRYDF